MAEDWQGRVSCPPTWTDDGKPVVPLPMTVARWIEEEVLDFTPTPWHRLVELIGVAYAYVRISRADACQKLINCYMMILPGLLHDCRLITEYRPALRHILDGFWAVMEWDASPPPLLQDFISSITPFEELPLSAQAAVHAVRASICKGQRAVALSHAQLAVEKSPGEGEWHHLLGSCQALPASGAAPSEALRHLRTAHRLRPGPHTAVSLARSLAATEKRRARALIDAALREHSHPYILSVAGEVLIMIEGFNVATAAEAKRLLERCCSIVGARSSIELKLADLCMKGGRDAEARAHVQKACSLRPSGLVPSPALRHLPHPACICCGNRPKPENKVLPKTKRILRRR